MQIINSGGFNILEDRYINEIFKRCPKQVVASFIGTDKRLSALAIDFFVKEMSKEISALIKIQIEMNNFTINSQIYDTIRKMQWQMPEYSQQHMQQHIQQLMQRHVPSSL